jgi:3-hydroxybutyryl-CoA dehydrogenase
LGDSDSLPEAFAIRRVAVIGAGVAGRSFALACAAAGFDVVIEDVMPANLRRTQEEYADLRAQAPPGRLEVALTVEDAVRAADVAVDFVPDELESKLEIFCLVDRMAPPKTVLLTPSDALSITDLASCTYRAERCVGLRGGSLLGGDVELMRSRFLSPEVEAAVVCVWQRLGLPLPVGMDVEPMLVKNLAG